MLKVFQKCEGLQHGTKWEKGKAKDGKFRYLETHSVIAPDLVPYCLRHTYCTDLQQKGVQLKTASYLMGHTDISVTANIDMHITEDTLLEASRLIGCQHVHSHIGKEKTG